MHVKLLCHFRIMMYLCMVVRVYSQSSHSQSFCAYLVSCNNTFICCQDTTYFGDEHGIDMAAVFGKVDHFDGEQEDWTQYVERLGHFFTANGITAEAKKKAVFLSVIGPGPYKILRNLLAPEKPSDKAFDALVAVLTRHYSPRPSEIVQRFRFHTCCRRQGETVTDYVARLRAIAEFCNFGAVLEDMLRDRLVCGVNSEAIQRKLLSESTLTFQKALEVAIGLEAADRDVRELKPWQRESDAPVTVVAGPGVNAVSPPVAGEPIKTHSSAIVCFRCGKAGHKANQCRFKAAKCHRCGKKGHLKKVCKSPPTGQKPGHRGHSSQAVRQLEQEEAVEEEPMYHVGSRRESSPPFIVQVDIDHCPVAMELDTGASVSLMAEATFKKLWPGRSLPTTNVRLCTYLKEPIQVVGSACVNVVYEDQRAQLPLIVVKGDGPTLLGRNWLKKLILNWSQLHYTRCAGPPGKVPRSV